MYSMLRGRSSFIFHLCDFGPFNSSPAFSVAPKRARARLGEFVRRSCRVNVMAGLIAAECERRRRRQWTVCWRVSSDHRCVDNCTACYVLVNTFIAILHYILDSRFDLRPINCQTYITLHYITSGFYPDFYVQAPYRPLYTVLQL